MEVDYCEQHESKVGENKKLESFRVALHKTVEAITSGVSEDKFIELYGGLEVLKKKRSATHKLHNLLKQSLFSSMTNLFESMIEEENLNKKFALLSSLCEENILETGAVSWRPPGCVCSHMRTFTISEKLKIVNNLEDYVSRKEAVGERLMDEVNTISSLTILYTENNGCANPSFEITCYSQILFRTYLIDHFLEIVHVLVDYFQLTGSIFRPSLPRGRQISTEDIDWRQYPKIRKNGLRSSPALGSSNL